MKDSTEVITLPKIFPCTIVPTKEDIFLLWDKYCMPEHIRQHSTVVATVASTISLALFQKGYPVSVECIYASALLHDIAKIHCISSKEHHNVVGAEWVLEDTGNYAIAQGVYYHNYLNPQEISLPEHILPVLVMYADSRVQHTNIVSLHERYEDLSTRYGKTQSTIEHIKLVEKQAYSLEKILEDILLAPIDTLLGYTL